MLCDLTTRSYADINCIGNPLPNTVAVILDNNLRKVPVGSVGRLYIGGPGLARGYVGNSDNEGFITNPFDISLAPLFGTRDLTKYRPNGEIELVGRLDDQVKIKGYRVNLRELELAIEGHRKVKQAAVLLRTEHEEVRVIAYVMPKEPLSSTELREFMRSQVADHLLPIRFIMVSHFPLTPSGKVAKNEFPSPALSRPNLDVAYREPTDQLEADLSSIWAQVLNVDDIGIDDDFLELGGDSLTGIRLAGIIQSHYGIELNMRDILTWPTIALFSQFVRKSLKSNALSQDKYVNPDS
jgi:acyl carrier protein